MPILRSYNNSFDCISYSFELFWLNIQWHCFDSMCTSKAWSIKEPNKGWIHRRRGITYEEGETSKWDVYVGAEKKELLFVRQHERKIKQQKKFVEELIKSTAATMNNMLDVLVNSGHSTTNFWKLSYKVHMEDSTRNKYHIHPNIHHTIVIHILPKAWSVISWVQWGI